MKTYHALVAALASINIAPVGVAAAISNEKVYVFDVPAEPLADALRAVAARAGLELYAPADAVGSLRTARLAGRLSARVAINRLLVGTGLQARFSEGAVIIEGRRPQAPEGSAGAEIVVTGTHIRNAPTANNVITLSQADMRKAGQDDLGAAVRSLPANFSGGQNPGVGSGAGLVNTNLNAASSINLRGLGPDATLTLLNGRRLPFDSAFQGVDVSAIPVAAVDRIEIVTDGASALYGSDAVAGIANVILKRDFDGLTTTARIGGATSGGDFEQQASAVGGLRWSGGGLIATYEFQHNSGIRASERAFSATLPPAVSLFPAARRHAVSLSAHQSFSSALEVSIDTIYDRRSSTTTGGFTSGASSLFVANDPNMTTFSIAPELSLALPNGWRVKAFGTYGTDRTQYGATVITNGGAPTRGNGCYCNRGTSAEVNGEGPLFALPGGTARLAVGGGVRHDGLQYTRYDSGALTQSFDAAQSVFYAFSELSLPLVAPALDLPGIRRLVVSVAGRHERYAHADSITTPKVGLIYEPVDGLALKATWGRSFRAPTFYERFVPTLTYLFPATSYGVGPAGKTILYTSGGNPDLMPERSENWTVSATLKPARIAGLSLTASYFNVAYRDRVQKPNNGSILSSFTNPAFAPLLTSSPSAAFLQALIGLAPLGLQNLSGSAYNPAAVVYVVDNRNRNVAAQAIHGVDFAVAYRRELGEKRSLLIDVAGTYLVSSQQILPGLPMTTLAGTIFNPSNLRIRGGVSYVAPRLTLSGFLNYVGHVEDRRFTPTYMVGARTSFDLIANYRLLGETNARKTLDVSLVANNLFNSKPATIRVSGPSDTPYDSTNFSPVGRFLAVSISRHW